MSPIERFAKILKVKKVPDWRGNLVYPEWFTILTVVLFSWFVIRLGAGIVLANDEEHCRLRSIGDVIIAPSYSLGCIIGKDRFDIRVN